MPVVQCTFGRNCPGCHQKGKNWCELILKMTSKCPCNKSMTKHWQQRTWSPGWRQTSRSSMLNWEKCKIISLPLLGHMWPDQSTECHFRIVGTLSDFFLQHSYEKNNKTRIFLHIWKNSRPKNFGPLGILWRFLVPNFKGNLSKLSKWAFLGSHVSPGCHLVN